MKRILIAIMSIVLVAGLTGGAFAYFSDTETTNSSTFAAGTLDLDYAGGDDLGTAYFALTNKAPGESGNASQTIKNSGSLPGELDITISAITNTESTGTTEYEGLGSGELGANATLALYVDVDESGTWTTGDIGLDANGTYYSYSAGDADLQYDTFNTYDSASWDNVYNGLMAAGAQDAVVALWAIDGSVGNTIQGDSASFTITFTLEQAAVDA